MHTPLEKSVKRPYLITRVPWLAAIAVAFLTPDVDAVPIVGVGPIGGGGGGSSPGSTDLLMIETSPFSVSSLGIAGAGLSGLAFQPVTGTLFASGGYSDGGNLYTIDPVTAAATLVGGNVFASVAGLAFDFDGTLFGSAAASFFEFPDILIKIDPNTGATSVVGSFGIADGAFDALAVDPTTGVLYALGGSDPFDELFTVDKLTGAATSLGAVTESGTGVGPPSVIAGLAFDGSGNLFASVGDGDGRILSIELSGSPTYTILGDARLAGSVSDIAIRIPEPGTMLLLGAVLSGLVVIRERRRRDGYPARSPAVDP